MSQPSAPEPEPLIEHVEGVRRLARQLVANAADAEDVAQDALLEASRQGPREGWSLAAWLRGVVRNKARERRRAERRRVAREASARSSGEAPSAAEVAARVEIHKRVLDAVLALPDPYRAVTWMRYFEDRSTRSIADVLGTPHETVRTHLRRAIERLRESLDASETGRSGTWRLALLPLLEVDPSSLGHVVWEGLAVGAKSKVALGLAGVALVLGTTWSLDTWPWSVATKQDDAPTREAATASIGAGPELQGMRADAPEVDVEGEVVDFENVDRERDLHGVVVRKDGTPVRGAQLHAFARPWEHSGLLTLDEGTQSIGRTRSARDGRFLIRLAAGAMVDLQASAAGLATTTLARVNAGERLRIVLEPGVDLCIEVRDAIGSPVPGASARVWSQGRFTGDPDVRAAAAADERGEAWVRGLTPGLELSVEILHDEHPTPWVQVTLPAQGELRKSITLAKGRVVTGRVVDAMTKQPLVGAIVGFSYIARRATRTDEDGRYTFRGWPEGSTSELTVLAPGYPRCSETVGDRTQVDFQVAAGVRVRGRVVDPNGTPLAGARVSLQSANNRQPKPQAPPLMAFPSAVTDASGGFALDGAAPAIDHRLAVQCPGFASHSDVVPAARMSAPELNLGAIQLGVGRRIRGVAVDGGGAPVARLQLSAAAVQEGQDPHYRWSETRYGLSGLRFTDDLGRFRFDDLAPGIYRVVARPAGLGERLVTVTVPPTGGSDFVRLVLGDTRIVEVDVVTTDGKPIEGMDVALQGSTTSAGGARTDATGRASVRCTSDVRRVALSFPGSTFDRYASTKPMVHELRPDDRLIRFVLIECGPATGRVLDAGGQPLGHVTIECRASDGSMLANRRCDPAGQFSIPVPLGGTVSLVPSSMGSREVESGAWTSAEQWLEGALQGVRAGDTDLELRVRPLALNKTLHVLVLLPDGAPAAGVQVRAPIGLLTERRGTTADDGRVLLEGLPDAPFTLWARPDQSPDGKLRSYARTRASSVRAGDEVYTLKLATGVTLQGRVVDEVGRGLVRLKVEVQEATGQRQTWESGPDGRFVGWHLHPDQSFPLDLHVTTETPEGVLLAGSMKGIRSIDANVVLEVRRSRPEAPR